ncbi:hypothetical protein J5N97_005457 [Dioscorea zingiberensis]|uniref:Uncharacterized protein n=1 Tax=Dioscorea zingiberensis TaxID=325984 RepID=A0A9D5D8K4_9LILI|nr:hypothetical protein J5N97_005457 [Dioscorea zingiberensis]
MWREARECVSSSPNPPTTKATLTRVSSGTATKSSWVSTVLAEVGSVPGGSPELQSSPGMPSPGWWWMLEGYVAAPDDAGRFRDVRQGDGADLSQGIPSPFYHRSSKVDGILSGLVLIVQDHLLQGFCLIKRTHVTLANLLQLDLLIKDGDAKVTADIKFLNSK